MVTLQEQIDIEAPFERLLWWVDHFEREFVRWSPYHLACQLLTGGIDVGDKVRFREIVMGFDYDVTGIIVRSERDNDRFRFDFESDRKMAVITFEGWRTGQGCRFCHTEAFGMQAPVIGPLVDSLIFKVLFREKCDWQLIRDDMILDNRLLADILISGIYPERIPAEDPRDPSGNVRV